MQIPLTQIFKLTLDCWIFLEVSRSFQNYLICNFKTTLTLRVIFDRNVIKVFYDWWGFLWWWDTLQKSEHFWSPICLLSNSPNMACFYDLLISNLSTVRFQVIEIWFYKPIKIVTEFLFKPFYRLCTKCCSTYRKTQI